jgi:hypothetical protein
LNTKEATRPIILIEKKIYINWKFSYLFDNINNKEITMIDAYKYILNDVKIIIWIYDGKRLYAAATTTERKWKSIDEIRE